MGYSAALYLLVTLQFLLGPAIIFAQEYVSVDIDTGTLRGQLETTYTNGPMYSFRGIPYAEPPVDELRFQPPVPKAAWDGVRDALQVGSGCPQDGFAGVSVVEDCLYLNVFSPALPSQNVAQKAVMVFIHGGCFTGGRGDSTTPHYLVDNDVVFVSINYRLGLLGFLNTGDMVVPGNMGLKDQTEALRWVQRNIAAFGGDPERVTIFGQSAGGASIHYHVLSPLSKGLFKNAIAMSGTALSPWAFAKNATDRAVRFAKYLGHTPTDSTDLVNFLRTVDPHTLVLNIGNGLSEEDSLSLFSCVWTPSIEPAHDSAFLTENPWTLVSEGRYNQIPYMSGATSLEQLAQTQPGGILSTEEQVNALNANFEEIVACDLRLPTRQEQLTGAGSVKQAYYNGSDITLQNNYTTAAFDSHLFFAEGVDTVVRSMARFSSYPVYYYEFSFVGPLSQFPNGPGAAHADDVNYLFASSSLDPDSDAGIMRRQMTAMWANFAKYDNPTPELDSLLTVNWTQYSDSSPSYLQIASPLSTGSNLFEPYMSFWHELLP